MEIEPFAMERWQSTFEHGVEINLSDSGVHPLTPRELVRDPDRLAALLETRLIYTQTNGTPELRERIAALYPGASRSHVQVVNGGAEANFLAAWSLVEPGAEAVVMVPNYMQLPGVLRGLGADVVPWPLRPEFAGPEPRWVADLDHLEELVGTGTGLIAICNPNNPTGACFSAQELDRICSIASRHGAWVLADEIYQGSEFDGRTTPTVFGRYDRAVVTNSLSKAYGLPGLRLGWAVGPGPLIDDLWMRHDYTTIGPGALSDVLATAALEPDNRERLLARTRRVLADNYRVVSRWVDQVAGLQHIPPRAGAMLFLRYPQPIGSAALAERLRVEESVLLVPGDHFGMDRWLRIGFGGETDRVLEGLRRLGRVLASVPGA